MIYNVIGLMSGSSLDGLDIAYVELTDVRNDWSYTIHRTACIPFEPSMRAQLQQASSLPVPDFLRLHTRLGKWMGTQVNDFITTHQLSHKVHFIASHGHTVFHEPKSGTSTQIGDGASIAAVTGLTTISDLRNMDVALGGQGAPIVPMADSLLFKEYTYCLNLGGIANVTINGAQPIAFDICPANQLLDVYAQKMGRDYDAQGDLARSGTVNPELLAQLNALEYYTLPAPKSLHNGFSADLHQLAAQSGLSSVDVLATYVAHISTQISHALAAYPAESGAKMLVTGGGALNTFLIEQIQAALPDVKLFIPEQELIQHKEALAMGLMGVLRWREEQNVWSSVTGAQRSSIGGAMWLGEV